ncbi:MAG: hypothetical protein AB1817_18445 [Chloroflexota bacterium]
MAISVKEFKQMQKDIRDIKRQLAREPRGGNGKRRAPTPKRQLATTPAREPMTDENARVLELLRRKGMIAELTPEEKARAARWDALPEEEKKRIWDEFFNLKLEKPLSDIIIENRR